MLCLVVLWSQMMMPWLEEIKESAEKKSMSHEREVLDLVKTNKENAASSQESLKKCSLGNSPDLSKASNLEHEPGEILVFVSASMPKTALQQLVRETKKYKARLILKGMVENSIQKTAQWVKTLGGTVDIDPRLFQKLQVTQVPVFALKTGEDWRILKGNVSLSFAHERLTE